MIWTLHLALSFVDDFSEGMNGWVTSNWKPEAMGAWSVSENGLNTTEDARFYAISKKMDSSFSTINEDLYVQYSVKQSQFIDCGGAYMKMFSSELVQSSLKGGEEEDVYSIMFGPDYCGVTKKTHLIFHHKGKNYENKQTLFTPHDQNLHLYTFALFKNGSYSFWLDTKLSHHGDLRTDYDFLPPLQIPDPTKSKPDDWVDTPTMEDVHDVKPEGWDDVPEKISDPLATKPEDWDDEDDGEWEPPVVNNPEYKGKWKPKMIDNPNYKGEWKHPLISNPDFKDDASIGKYEDISIVAFELWQVKSGTSFDSILVSHDFAQIEQGFAEFNLSNQKNSNKDEL